MPHQGQKESRRLPECNAESLKQCMQRLFDAKTFHDIKSNSRIGVPGRQKHSLRQVCFGLGQMI